MVGVQSSNIKSSRRWCVALAILAVVIIGLIAAIVILNFNRGDGDSEKIGEPEVEERQIALGDFMTNMNYAAEELYEKDPSNISAIVDIYSKSFNQIVNKGNYSFAYVILQEEYVYLNKINAPADVILDALLSIVNTDDFEGFGYVSQYNICYRIIETAKRTNDVEVIEKYQPYLDEALPFYEEHLRATAEEAKRYEEELQNANNGGEYDN